MPSESSMASGIRLSRDQILADVRQIVGAYTEIVPEAIQEDHNLEADLGCDSLDVVEISMEVEEHFGISVPDEIGGARPHGRQHRRRRTAPARRTPRGLNSLARSWEE